MTVLVITVPLVLLIAAALTALVVREFATRGRRRVVGALVERAELLRFESANLDRVRLRLSAAEHREQTEETKTLIHELRVWLAVLAS